MAKITKSELSLLASMLAVQKIKEKHLKEECQDTLDKYIKIRDILNEYNNEEPAPAPPTRRG